MNSFFSITKGVGFDGHSLKLSTSFQCFFYKMLGKEKKPWEIVILHDFIHFLLTLRAKIFARLVKNCENLFREPWNPFIQNTNDLHYDF